MLIENNNNIQNKEKYVKNNKMEKKTRIKKTGGSCWVGNGSKRVHVKTPKH